jgi:hypothetical protein
MSGKYEKNITIGCPWRGVRSAVPSEIIDVLNELCNSGQTLAETAPCLRLPPNLWNEPRLVSACPECGRKVRHNPFIVDSRRHCDERTGVGKCKKGDGEDCEQQIAESILLGSSPDILSMVPKWTLEGLVRALYFQVEFFTKHGRSEEALRAWAALEFLAGQSACDDALRSELLELSAIRRAELLHNIGQREESIGVRSGAPMRWTIASGLHIVVLFFTWLTSSVSTVVWTIVANVVLLLLTVILFSVFDYITARESAHRGSVKRTTKIFALGIVCAPAIWSWILYLFNTTTMVMPLSATISLLLLIVGIWIFVKSGHADGTIRSR